MYSQCIRNKQISVSLASHIW